MSKIKNAFIEQVCVSSDPVSTDQIHIDPVDSDSVNPGMIRRKKAFIPFFTCGDPSLEATKELVKNAAASGAALIELGIPFSDPTAEGPVIQAANIRALNNKVTTDKIFEMVKELRQDIDTPLCFMTYANVVYSYDAEKFIRTCSEIGIDGLILPDVPYEEREEFLDLCRKYDVDLISFIAPTSKDRIKMIAKDAQGFIYLVAALGVTGMRSSLNQDLPEIIKTIREYTDVPVAVGFGISTPEQARTMAEIADGVICGSAIIKQIASNLDNGQSISAASAFVDSMVKAVNEASAVSE